MYQVEMATIRKRKRKDGTFGYTAQIRIMRGGWQVYQESRTFDRQVAAQAWGDVTGGQWHLGDPGLNFCIHSDTLSP
jgi:predicted oxidoreductase